jgi:uracil-DNA glycosylase
VETPGPVPPGTGWPGDPASQDTPVAHDAQQVAELAASAPDLTELTARQSVCRACPRLVAWREELAVKRRKSFITERYWGRPIPGWGADDPRVLIVGLAPAAHGGNRTGRVFTGDRSGDFLYAALYRCGLAVQPTSVAADDGQRLIGARMVAAVRCAPPGSPCRGRGRPSGMVPRYCWSRTTPPGSPSCCSAATTRVSRTHSPAV